MVALLIVPSLTSMVALLIVPLTSMVALLIVPSLTSMVALLELGRAAAGTMARRERSTGPTQKLQKPQAEKMA
jgi:hypothetical protein